jgi:ABC-type uncharacterized transport system permease subunit
MDRRRFIDRLSGIGIKATSALVLVAVAGMFVQIFTVAFPLWESVEWRATAAKSNVPATPPDWIGQTEDLLVFRANSRRRHWVAASDQDTLWGQLQTKETIRDQWSTLVYRINLPPEFARPDQDHRVLILDGLQLLAVPSPSGALAIIDVERPDDLSLLATSRWESLSPVAGGRMVIQAHDNVVSLYQLGVGHDRVPLVTKLSEHHLSQKPDQILVSPGDHLALIRLGQDVLLWQLYSDELLPMEALRSAEVVSWTSRDQIKVVTARGDERYFRLKGFPNFDMQQLFEPQWRSGYSSAVFRWLPTVDNEDSFPLFSLWPLLWGTLKAALMALLFALPIGIPTAIFVGFFMSPRLRDRIKPVIELLAAIPTVVVGAIAAVAVAPVFYQEFAGFLGMLIIIPLGVAGVAVLVSSQGDAVAARWQSETLPLKISPLVLLLAVLGYYIGKELEAFFFAGDLGQFLVDAYSISLAQRNTVLLGFSLGIALVPTLFTISEEAIHAVPRQLAAGCLALGSSHWQSFRDVVLPIAFPGILAAVLVSFGRAIGETMILVMVSGNTPLMDWDLFSGVRTFTATLALELPEAPRNGIHYRILFMAAFLLFAFTFVVNTVAELTRSRVTRMTTAWQGSI